MGPYRGVSDFSAKWQPKPPGSLGQASNIMWHLKGHSDFCVEDRLCEGVGGKEQKPGSPLENYYNDTDNGVLGCESNGTHGAVIKLHVHCWLHTFACVNSPSGLSLLVLLGSTINYTSFMKPFPDQSHLQWPFFWAPVDNRPHLAVVNRRDWHVTFAAVYGHLPIWLLCPFNLTILEKENRTPGILILLHKTDTQ